MVVLVNRDTASSAEIVTAALQERGRAKVVGTRTYGKGVFQEIADATQRRRCSTSRSASSSRRTEPTSAVAGSPQGSRSRAAPAIKPNVYVYDNPLNPGLKPLRVAEGVLAGELH